MYVYVCVCVRVRVCARMCVLYMSVFVRLAAPQTLQ